MPLQAAGPRRSKSSDASEERQTIRDIARSIPPECYENPTVKGLSLLGRDLFLHVAALILLLFATAWPLVLLGWALAALTIAGMFVMGHDAAHGSLFKSPRLNYFAGQLGMLPSLHAMSVWAYGHNRVHHAFAGCEGLDFVWHPMTIAEYRHLSPWKKLRHRVDWSVFGAGTYYARAIWWNRLVRMPPPPGLETRFHRDRLTVAAYLLLMSVVVVWIGWEQTDTAHGALWAWTRVLLVPWLLWNVLIGWAVYIHHTSPATPWHSRQRWRKFRGQVETTTNFKMPWWLNFFWHNIFLHIPHHVDPRIPSYNLPAAAVALDRDHAAVAASQPFRFGDYLESTRHCKLYDFDREAWTNYAGRDSVKPQSGA